MQEREIFYQLSPDPMWVQDRETLRFLDVNDAAIDVYGYSREEFLSRTSLSLRADDDTPRLLETLHSSGEGRSSPVICRHRKKSGDILAVQIRAQVISWKGRPAELVSVRDIGQIISGEAARLDLHLRQPAPGEARDLTATQFAEQATNLRTAQRLIRIGTWKYEFWSGRIFGSPELHEMYAVPANPAGEPYATFRARIHPDDRESTSEAYRAFVATGAPAFEFGHRAVHPDGRIVHIRGVGEFTETPEGRLLTGVVQDVTRQLEQDSRLRLLDLSVSRLNDVVLIFKAGGAPADLQAPIVYVNPAFQRITGLGLNDVLGQPVCKVFEDTVPDVPAGFLEAALSHAASLRSDIQLRTRDGRRVPAEIDLVPVQGAENVLTHWVAMIRDMSEKHAAEARARSNEARYEMLSRSTQDVVWDWDFETGVINWNQNFRKMAGNPDAPLEGAPPSSWIDRLHPDDRERVVEGFFAAAAGDAENWSAEYRFMPDDGGVRFVFDRGFVSRNAQGDALRMVGSMVDITTQKVAEMRLVQAEKLEALGQITGGVAHDFNNLLAIIIGNTESLLDRIEDPRSRRMLELVSVAAERGRDLTGRLLAFARRIPMTPVPLDLNAFVERSAELFRRTFRSNICIEIDTSASPANIEADASQLELVLLNLAVNARDAMREGGTLTLATRLSEEGGRREVVLTVTDNGDGMDAESLRRCLEPFYTTKPVGKGVGLGLSMAFGFMAQSGGRLAIESVPGRGTCVSLHFPLTDLEVPETLIEADPATLVGGDEHILLVEDDPGVRNHAMQLLADLGYEVTVKVNADEAIDYLRAGGTADLLLTDLVMPGTAGVVHLVAEARARLPRMEILYSSGYPKELVAEDGRLPPDIEFLPKPYRRAELAARLRLLLDRQAAREAAAQEPEV